MRILAIDTTAKTASAALLEDKRLKMQYTVNTTRTHSENMLPMIEHMLGREQFKVSDIDLFAVSAGPGSFTGVRIGVSLIKGLAHGTGKPCVGVNTLCALAENVEEVLREGEIVCPVMDARREQVYFGIFQKQNGALVPLEQSGADGKSAVLSRLATYDAPVWLVGDGAYLFAEDSLPQGLKTAPQSLLWQSGYSVGLCALLEYLQNPGKSYDSGALVPIYYRPSQAQRMLEEKTKQQGEEKQ